MIIYWKGGAILVVLGALLTADVFAFSPRFLKQFEYKPVHTKFSQNRRVSKQIHRFDYARLERFKSLLWTSPSKDSNEEGKKSSFGSAKDRVLRTITSNPSRSLSFTALMVLSGALLGPFLDSYHSAFGVLQYDTPIKVNEIGLTTAWWVPELFGLAGLIIGWLYILLDNALSSSSTINEDKKYPSPPIILVCISFFTLQYWLSGILYQASFDRSTILMIMSILSAIGFLSFDATVSGFLASFATAFGGPLIEVGLITTLSGSGTGTGYHYNDPGETGFFPLWISPIYFLGGPAVGNLARGIWRALSGERTPINDIKLEQDIEDENFHEPQTKMPKCKDCNDTRIVGCPNCDAVGFYTSYNRRVKCNCCKGKGLVICRTCFSQYDDDPYDIEGIRDFLSRIPD